jgi:sortase A
VLGAIGRVLIAIGLLLFGFAAYQVWGTGIQEARAQSALESEFEAVTATVAALPTTTVAAPTTTTPATTAASAPDGSSPEATVATTVAPTTTTTEVDPGLVPLLGAKPGDAVAILQIKKIGLKKIIVSGVGVEQLREGPGHYRTTALPGQRGNAAIAGHRTAYGSPFKEVDKLEPGDEITVTNVLKETFVYKVRDTKIVEPTAVDVLAPSDEAILTITSCHPLYTANQRIIVTSVLDEAATKAAVRPATPLSQESELTKPGDTLDPAVTSVPTPDDPTVSTTVVAGGEVTLPTPSSTVDDGSIAVAEEDAFAKGWFSDKKAPPHVAGWGLVVSLIALAAWQLSKKTDRNWLGFAVGVLPFLVALYFFYENVNRLLPPTI